MNNQDKIWDHFQNVAPESFLLAKPRMDFIVNQIVRQKKQTTPTVLNIGVGDGYLEKRLREKGWAAYLLDPNDQAVKKMRALDIHAECGYIQKMPFQDNLFDFVIASEVLEHLTDQQRREGLLEVRRVLKNGGLFIGTVPYAENLETGHVLCPECGCHFHRWGHQKSFDLSTLSEEISRYFELIEIKRTAYVLFKHEPLSRKIKNLIKLLLAKMGEMIATPNIYFCAMKKSVDNPIHQTITRKGA